MTMRTISVKLSEDLERRLASLAKAQRVSRSEVLRVALLAFQPELPESFTAAASDLAGCVGGPKDLSTAEKHMMGYGS